MLAEGRLIIILRFSVDKFVASGLMRREYDRVKLHLTLINTLFRKEQGDLGDKDLGQARESFDCRPVLSGWGSLSLGEVEEVLVHLSLRREGRGWWLVGVADNNASLSSRELTPSSHVMQW